MLDSIMQIVQNYANAIGLKSITQMMQVQLNYAQFIAHPKKQAHGPGQSVKASRTGCGPGIGVPWIGAQAAPKPCITPTVTRDFSEISELRRKLRENIENQLCQFRQISIMQIMQIQSGSIELCSIQLCKLCKIMQMQSGSNQLRK